MSLQKKSEVYLEYCKKQKELDTKTIKAYRIDLRQFIEFMDKFNCEMTKENLNQYLIYIHENYKQKTVKRKIASVKAFFVIWKRKRLYYLKLFQEI